MKTLTIADLFCGAGGTSTGAAQELGWKVFCLTTNMITAKQAEKIIATINSELRRLDP